MSEWREVRLEELFNIKSSKRIYASEYVDEGIPFYRSKEITEIRNKNKISTPFFISEERYKQLSEKHGVPKKGDILITSVGTIGVVWHVDQDLFYFKDGNLNWIESNEDEIMSKFVYYWLDSSIGYKNIINQTIGTSQKALTIEALKNIKLYIPEKKIMRKITHTLSAYDQLIENNHRRIALLEQTAEELYKEWFVRMRFPGYEKTKFEKGIPKGWEVQKLSEVIKVTDGTHDTPKEVSDGRPLVTGKNIVNGQIDFNTTYNISEDDYKKINVRSSVEKNDILYSNIGTIGQMSIVHDDNKYSVKNLIILKTSKYNFYEYIYLHFKNEACQNHFDSIANGASQRFISLTEMRNYKILIPNKEILEEFRSYVRILFNQVKNLTIQNQNLTKQRDLLLPRLMNGTISVE